MMLATPSSSSETRVESRTEVLSEVLLLEEGSDDYKKIINSIKLDNAIDIIPSVLNHILLLSDKFGRLDLVQELVEKLKDTELISQLHLSGHLSTILLQILDTFSTESSQSVQFELMSIVCSVPGLYMTEKLLSKLHTAASSSSALIRRQSLTLVMEALPPDRALIFLFAYLEDDDPRVRTTATESLVRAVKAGCSLPLEVYQKLVVLLSDQYYEVRLHAVQVIPYIVEQHSHIDIPIPDSTHVISLPHHAFTQLCSLMGDISINVRIEVARTLSKFKNIHKDFLIQTLDKKVQTAMKKLPEGCEGRVQSEYSSGRKWGGDMPVKSSQAGETQLIESAACGAFIHGMEDEFAEVRMNSVQSISILAESSAEFGSEAMPHLVDMLNDEIQDVRLLAISSLQTISQHVDLHEDQLETVLSVLEESNVEIRHSLHELLSSSKLTSQVCVRRVLRGLLDNLEKYPTDRMSICRCVRGVGTNNASVVALLAHEMLSKHPYLHQTEPNMDDAAYIVTMILVFNAAKTKSVIISLFHGYTAEHYVYIHSLLPDLVPILPQVHKIFHGSLPADLTQITTTLNNMIKLFFSQAVVRNFQDVPVLLRDIAKIAKCSGSMRAQTRYAALIIDIIVQTHRLQNNSSASRIQSVIDNLCFLDKCFHNTSSTLMLSKYLKLYFICFLYCNVPNLNVTEGAIVSYIEFISNYSARHGVTLPTSIRNFLSSSDVKTAAGQYLKDCFNSVLTNTLIDNNLQISSAEILTPVTNLDRINEFPCHLTHKITVEAETNQLDLSEVAVKIAFPGDTNTINQGSYKETKHAESSYYESDVFVGGGAWSDPGTISVCLVVRYNIEEYEAVFRELLQKKVVWLSVSDDVHMKLYPRVPY